MTNDLKSKILDAARLAGVAAGKGNWSSADVAVAYWLRGGSSSAELAEENGIQRRAEISFRAGFQGGRSANKFAR